MTLGFKLNGWVLLSELRIGVVALKGDDDNLENQGSGTGRRGRLPHLPVM